MFTEFGMTEIQKQAIRSMFAEFADYVDEYITYGSVDFECLAPVMQALQNVRNPNHEPTHGDLLALWKVVQKAQRTHCGPMLPKEDRIAIYTNWKTLDAFYQRMTTFLDSKKQQESAIANGKPKEQNDSNISGEGDVKEKENVDEELFNPEDQVDFSALSEHGDDHKTDETSSKSTGDSSSSSSNSSESSETSSSTSNSSESSESSSSASNSSESSETSSSTSNSSDSSTSSDSDSSEDSLHLREDNVTKVMTDLLMGLMRSRKQEHDDDNQNKETEIHNDAESGVHSNEEDMHSRSDKSEAREIHENDKHSEEYDHNDDDLNDHADLDHDTVTTQPTNDSYEDDGLDHDESDEDDATIAHKRYFE